MSRSQLSFVAFATTCVVLSANPVGGLALAQDVLLDVKSPSAGARASIGIAIGDWDGDGIGDLAIGAPFDNTVGLSAGAVRIHSGKDGSMLAVSYGASPDDEFGSALVRMPDLDGDGIDDLAIQAPYAKVGGAIRGSIYLYAGRTFAFLRRIDGPPTGLIFGSPLGALDDVDGDGVADLFVGNLGLNDLLHVDSGADGHEIITINGPTGEFFGQAASTIDDFDGDGVRDLLVGAPKHLDSAGQQVGAAYVVSSVTGAILRTQEGTFAYEGFGQETAALADLDGDGVHDYAVSANNDGSFQSAMTSVFSGASGAQLANIVAPSQYEALHPGVVAAGDLNGDGVGDFAIVDDWNDGLAGRGIGALLVSGKTFLPLDRIESWNYGPVIAPFGDLNGDGFDDLVFGSFDASTDGEVQIYSGDDLWLDATPSQALAGELVELATREGTTGALTLLALEAIDGTPTFQIVGGVRSFGPLGGMKLFDKVPAGLAGHDFTFRAYANDAAGKVVASATQVLSCR